MTLLRRRPREVYRVYAEEEYLRGAEAELATSCEWPKAVASTGRSFGSLRVRRMVAVTMLVGVTGTVGGAIVHNSSLFTSHRRAGRAARHLLAATRSRPSRPPVVVSSQAKPVRRVVARPRSSSNRNLAQRGAPIVTARTRAVKDVDTVENVSTVKDVATVRDVATIENAPATAGTATTENISVELPTDVADEPTEPTPTQAPLPLPSRKNQAEFGFER
jgi:hypothetical protein